jgi:tRNA pseudouridine55 synthase
VIDGAILIDKPTGMTSHDVVAKLRQLLRQKKIGHTGTLDPFATGLLVLCLGKATRLVQFLMATRKTYTATLRLGYATDTQDYTGKPLGELRPSKNLDNQQLLAALATFTGNIAQIPPMYSAKKVAGQTLYRLARQGKEVARAANNIIIYELTLDPENPTLTNHPDGTTDISLRVVCSAGTYIRTLAADIGAHLGYGGHLVALRREVSGAFDLSEAVTLPQLAAIISDNSDNLAPKIISLERLAAELPQVELSDTAQILAVQQGRQLDCQTVSVKNSPDCVTVGSKAGLFSLSGQLIAIAELIQQDGTYLWQPRTVLQ